MSETSATTGTGTGTGTGDPVVPVGPVKCLVPQCQICPEPKIQRCTSCNPGYYLRNFPAENGTNYQECYDLTNLLLSLLGIAALLLCCCGICYLFYNIGKRYKAKTSKQRYTSASGRRRDSYDSPRSPRSPRQVTRNGNQQPQYAIQSPKVITQPQYVVQNPTVVTQAQPQPQYIIQQPNVAPQPQYIIQSPTAAPQPQYRPQNIVAQPPNVIRANGVQSPVLSPRYPQGTTLPTTARRELITTPTVTSPQRTPIYLPAGVNQSPIQNRRVIEQGSPTNVRRFY